MTFFSTTNLLSLIKRVLFKCFLITSFSAFSQYTSIPDPAFEQALIDLQLDNKIDGQVLTAIISNVEQLNIPNNNIYDLTGIKDFLSLQILICSNNQITTLNVGKNSYLEELDCSGNNINSLTFDNNIELTKINCSYNQINSLDLSQVESLLELDCSYNLIPTLSIPPTLEGLTRLNCGYNRLTNLDISNCATLQLLECGNNRLGYIVFPPNGGDLKTLRCNNNSLTSIDVGLLSDLTFIDCSGNQLSQLDLSYNTHLTLLDCQSNRIEILDLTKNRLLRFLNCSYNRLMQLDIRNGSNRNIIEFIASGNLRLSCIEVDEPIYSTNNWQNIDASASFSDDCGYIRTLIPDIAFEQELVRLGLDNIVNGWVSTENISSVGILDISNKNIADLTGIEDFSSLMELNCSRNQLVDLNMSKNKNLKILDCAFNPLKKLWIFDNENLIALDCGANQLKNIDLSNNKLLSYLKANSTNLYELDVSNNYKLSYIYCNNNNNLRTFYASNGNNQSIIEFSALNNPNLSCIEVNDPIYSANNWLNTDPSSNFSKSCSEIAKINLSSNTFFNGIYPNPAKRGEVVNIRTQQKHISNRVKILNMLGKVVYQKLLNSKDGNIEIHTEFLTSGVYHLVLSNKENYTFVIE